jgi:alpha,alpha-trehalase
MATLRILLVEDDPSFRLLVKEWLSDHFPSLVFEEAGDGPEAIDKINQFRPQLVFMDIRLPGENGLQLTRKIKSQSPQTSIVILTNYDMPEYRQVALQNGADDFFSKDAPFDQVMNRVESLFPELTVQALPKHAQVQTDGEGKRTGVPMNHETTVFPISSAYDAVIFDLDGVVTKTAKVHAEAWKRLFDEYLERRALRDHSEFQPFDIDRDYRRYVDGKPRYDGVKSFLESRGIELPYGAPDDASDRETVCGLGNRKNQLFQETLRERGVEVYGSTIDLIRHLRSRRFKTAIVSSSKNCAAVLEAANIAHLFDVKVDGVDAQALGLEGKPAPDIFLEAARRLGIHPDQAIIVEDAIAGVQAGRQGNFGLVIGVDREGQRGELQNHGAHKLIRDLSEIMGLDGVSETRTDRLRSALECMEEISERLRNRRLAVFLDYDGTLTPIVQRPELAILSEDMRETVKTLANRCTVAVISGRDLRDVRDHVGIDTIFYAGSHGFDIAGPKGQHLEYQEGTDFLPILNHAEKCLRDRLDTFHGARVERKRFSIAVHYREVSEDRIAPVEAVIDEILADHGELRKSQGKKIFELQPKIDWHKGKAVLWLLEVLKLNQENALPLYIGDDVTDEDAFRTLKGRGIGIVVEAGTRPTVAQYVLKDPGEVKRFLQRLSTDLERIQ